VRLGSASVSAAQRPWRFVVSENHGHSTSNDYEKVSGTFFSSIDGLSSRAVKKVPDTFSAALTSAHKKPS